MDKLILVIEDELLEEEKQEEQAPKSVLDETVTVRGNTTSFDMGAQWINLEPGVTGYTYTTTTDGIYMTTMRR